MSENYLQFSFNVDITNERIKKWATNFLSYPKNHGKFEDAEDSGFDWDSRKNGLHIWAEENGNVENVITFLIELLNQPGYPNNEVGFSYSYTCSNMRVGEFGGGAVKVTRTLAGVDIKSIDTGQWLAA